MMAALRCGRDYANTVQVEQTPDPTSKLLPNGEHELFSLHLRCRYCGIAHFEQKLNAKECGRKIARYRMEHATCKARAEMRNRT